MKLMQLTQEEQEELHALLAPYLADEQVRSMARFVQHGNVNTLEHCLSVARTSWWIVQRLHLSVDNHTLVAGALLHDFFLYDWHGAGWQHSYRHAEQARTNAVARFGVDEATQNVIRSHMWPISITHVPSSREAFVVCVADKLVSVQETLFQRNTKKG